MKTFKRIYIEITNCCNLKCSFCPPTQRTQAFMDLASFETVLKKIEGHGRYVYLHIKGEPMLHPEFLEILDLCSTYGLMVNLTTNGTMIGDYAKDLIASRALRQVSFSLQSHENLEDEDGFRAYISSVLQLIEEGRQKSEIIFELRLWNYEGVMTDFEVDKNQIALSMIMDGLKVSPQIIEAIPHGKGIKLMNQVYLSKSAEFHWPDMNLDIIDSVGTCYGLRQQVGILVNGDVVPCCLDGEGAISLGNVFNEDFESIVTSVRAQAMIEGFEQRQINEPLCMRCGYRQRFN